MKTNKVKYNTDLSYFDVIVKDKLTGKFLPSVNVCFTGTHYSGLSDGRGKISFHSIKPEMYMVKFQLEGYYPQVQFINFRTGEIKEQEIHLLARFKL